jgi:4a-hydroxytetrahydrobiopterin dehydratase
MIALAEKSCAPCNKQTPRMAGKAIEPYLKEISTGWYVIDGKRIRRKFKLMDFRENISFVNKIAEIAEEEGHHPDLCILWNILEVTLWTHAIGGLSENDFILAAKLDELYDAVFKRSEAN